MLPSSVRKSICFRHVNFFPRTIIVVVNQYCSTNSLTMARFCSVIRSKVIAVSL